MRTLLFAALLIGAATPTMAGNYDPGGAGTMNGNGHNFNGGGMNTPVDQNGNLGGRYGRGNSDNRDVNTTRSNGDDALADCNACVDRFDSNSPSTFHGDGMRTEPGPGGY